MYIFGRRLDVKLEERLVLLGVFCDQDGLAVGIKTWPACPSCHLVVFAGRNGNHALPCLVSAVIPYYHPPGRKVESCSKGGCR